MNAAHPTPATDPLDALTPVDEACATTPAEIDALTEAGEPVVLTVKSPAAPV